MIAERRSIGIALLGSGSISGCMYKLVERQRENFVKKVGCQIEIKKILANDQNKEWLLDAKDLLTNDINEILSDEEIDIVVELMGGVQPAKDYILQAFNAGKHVVTANKDLLSACGQEIGTAASHKGRVLKFEAAVAGGIPVISPLMKTLAGNDIEEVIGIVNTTTNFILTTMTVEGMEYSDAVLDALGKGKAEVDPTEDIEGIDAAKKCAILASVAFRTWVTADDVMKVGIGRITASDIHYAKEMGYVIKQLGVAKESDGEIVASVYPALIPADHPLALVNEQANAVFVRGDAVGEIMLYGRSSDDVSAAGAVLGDVMEIASSIYKGVCCPTGTHGYRRLGFKSQSEISNQFFLRLKVEDKPGVLAAVANVFGINHVSIKQLLQKSLGSNEAELMIVTEKVREQNFREALSVLAEMDRIRAVSNVLRVHGLK